MVSVSSTQAYPVALGHCDLVPLSRMWDDSALLLLLFFSLENNIVKHKKI